MSTDADAEQNLRELARENPEAFERVAERAGGAIERRLMQLLEEEHEGSA
jgi:hypothetical protein